MTEDLEKINNFLKSKDPELKTLGIELCRKEYPTIWAALLNYSGTCDDIINDDVLQIVSENPHINVGSEVLLRGLDNCPTMVVTELGIQMKKIISGRCSYSVFVTAIFYNESTASFPSITQRMECFKLKKDKDE